MGVKFDTVKRLYDEGKLSENGVRNAVIKEWITQEEMKSIVSVVEEPEV